MPQGSISFNIIISSSSNSVLQPLHEQCTCQETMETLGNYVRHFVVLIAFAWLFLPGVCSTKSTANDEGICQIQGVLNVTESWYGFLAFLNFSQGNGTIRFKLSYPANHTEEHLLLYRENDMTSLHSILERNGSCWEKHNVINLNRDADEQAQDFRRLSEWNSACARTSDEQTSSWLIECNFERYYQEPARVFVAVSGCMGNDKGLYLDYLITAEGYDIDGGCSFPAVKLVPATGGHGDAVPLTVTSRLTVVGALVLLLFANI